MEGFIPRASLRAGDLPDEDLVDKWQQSIAPMLQARSVKSDGPEGAVRRMDQFHLGAMLFVDCAFPAQRYRRDDAMLAQHDDADHMTLQMYLKGGNRVVNGAHAFRQSAGHVYAVDLADTVDALSDDSETIVVVLPHQLLQTELPGLSSARGEVFAGNPVSERVFRDFLVSMRTHLPMARAGEAEGLTQGLLSLLDALAVHGDTTASTAQPALFASICRYIDSQLNDPGLGVDAICARFRCSRATLYRLFQTHGGVRDHIRRRRLMAAFKAITSPRHTHRGLFDIALDFGFISPSHFSSLFRDHFGMSPSEARQAAEQQAPQRLGRDLAMPSGESVADDAHRMWNWAKSLTSTALTGW